ncbi:uncharacterized protein LOC120908249 [Anopheles arabiensis]|uniref:uncharacterized protein LOC120908245 n=1 Tax=Anopheles arabiensis TaxID=7173 RepID=UPI001AAD88B0|nr:uncharacterized protein LOC120908245 [Anopheles arabiensis]XP_040175107.1 uncharacterized protein LOC120908249 [Anopheles arabiensis]
MKANVSTFPRGPYSVTDIPELPWVPSWCSSELCKILHPSTPQGVVMLHLPLWYSRHLRHSLRSLMNALLAATVVLRNFSQALNDTHVPPQRIHDDDSGWLLDEGTPLLDSSWSTTALQ